MEARALASVHPNAQASFLVGYGAPSPGMLVPAGERLFDSTSPRYFRVVQPSQGGVDVFRAPIPCDPVLAGLTVVVQAGIIGSGQRILCNALDLTVSYW